MTVDCRSVARKWSAWGVLQLLLIKMFMARCRCRCRSRCRCRCRCRCPLADDFCWGDMNHHKSKCGINIYRDFIIMPGQAQLTKLPCMLCSSHNNSSNNNNCNNKHSNNWHYNNKCNKEHIRHAWESHAVQLTNGHIFFFMAGKFCAWICRVVIRMAQIKRSRGLRKWVN